MDRRGPFRHQFGRLFRRLAMSEPSTAAARLQVLGMTGDFAGLLTATTRHSDRPGFKRLDRTGCGCFLTDDAPRVLLEATEVIGGFMNVRG